MITFKTFAFSEIIEIYQFSNDCQMVHASFYYNLKNEKFDTNGFTELDMIDDTHVQLKIDISLDPYGFQKTLEEAKNNLSKYLFANDFGMQIIKK